MDKPILTSTRAGSPALILFRQEYGDKKIIGAWWSGPERGWIPHSWTEDGYSQDSSVKRSLDIFIPDVCRALGRTK